MKKSNIVWIIEDTSLLKVWLLVEIPWIGLSYVKFYAESKNVTLIDRSHANLAISDNSGQFWPENDHLDTQWSFWSFHINK